MPQTLFKHRRRRGGCVCTAAACDIEWLSVPEEDQHEVKLLEEGREARGKEGSER